MTEYGIFNDESADYTADEALEADFYSREDAEAALAARYADDERAHVHPIKEPDDDEEGEDDDPADDEEDGPDGEAYRKYPVKY